MDFAAAPGDVGGRGEVGAELGAGPESAGGEEGERRRQRRRWVGKVRILRRWTRGERLRSAEEDERFMVEEQRDGGGDVAGDEHSEKGRRKRGSTCEDREHEKSRAMPVLEASMLEEAREE